MFHDQNVARLQRKPSMSQSIEKFFCDRIAGLNFVETSGNDADDSESRRDSVRSIVHCYSIGRMPGQLGLRIPLSHSRCALVSPGARREFAARSDGIIDIESDSGKRQHDARFPGGARRCQMRLETVVSETQRKQSRGTAQDRVRAAPVGGRHEHRTFSGAASRICSSSDGLNKRNIRGNHQRVLTPRCSQNCVAISMASVSLRFALSGITSKLNVRASRWRKGRWLRDSTSGRLGPRQ